MISVFIPFIILSLWSYLLLLKYNVKLHKAYLFVTLSIVFYLLFLGKLGFLIYSIYLLQILTIILLIFLIFKIKIDKNNFQKFFILLIIYSILIWICKDLFYYKYDEFSEYGITSKLLFSENNVPSNIDYLQKGSHHKINLISYFHYFFLKNSTKLFQESITYLAHSFFILLLLLNICDFIKFKKFKKFKKSKKFLIFITFYFLIYSLGPGLDRLYVDTIIGLVIVLLLLVSFKKNKYISDYYLIFLLALILPMIKSNGILILIGLMPIILIENIFRKKFVIFGILVLSLISYNFVSNFYFTNLNYYGKKNIIKKYEVHESSAFDLKQLNHQANLSQKQIANLDGKFILKFSNKQIKNLLKNGIYHSETFLIFNKIISKSPFNFKLIQIPINLFIWFIIVILITFFIAIKKKNKNLYWISILYLGFISSYYIMLMLWSIKHNLVNTDLELLVSWQRHLGSLLIGIIFFLLVKFFQIYSSLKIIIIFLILSMSISFPNSIRLFMPIEIIQNELFWTKKINQRKELKIISQDINSKFKNYSNIIFAFHKNDDPYFEPILRYELIKHHTFNIDNDFNLMKIIKIYNTSLNKNKLYLFKDNKYNLRKVELRFEKFLKDFSSYKKINLTKKHNIKQIEIYEIDFEK